MENYNLFALTGTAKTLYEEVAKDAPIYDFHCHLSPKEIYENRPFENVRDVLLGGDHYKWRAMRYAGVSEELVTGCGDKLLKFKAWAKTCERLIGCPLYAWSMLEMKLFFHIAEPLSADNAEEIYNRCNAVIREENLTPLKIIAKMNVRLICTTDNPADDLYYHKKITESPLTCKVLPTFRPESVLKIQSNSYCGDVAALSAACGKPIFCYGELLEALRLRLNYFVEAGCRLSDHSLENYTYYETNEEEVSALFLARMNGTVSTEEQTNRFVSYTLKKLAGFYSERGLVMQLHIGALRNTNTAAFQQLGADTGYDIPNDLNIAASAAKLLDSMELEGNLPKTILYACNAKDNLSLSTLALCFTQVGCAGKVQFGGAWWHDDHKEGMVEQLTAIAHSGALPYFVGMLTDSRSFLSYARHDYFRRILCSVLGDYADNGDFQGGISLLKEITEDICWRNIVNYLGMEES